MLADESLLSGEDAQNFDCQTCPLAERLEALDAENAEAWRIFGRIYSRLALDMPGFVEPFLARVLADYDTDDALDLSERLGVIYDVLNPPKNT
jgi:hypothetical protein